jgi:uncharacterized protein DUF5818
MMRLALLLLFAGAALSAESFTGVITDSACVARHTMAADSKCIEECLKLDKSTKYVLFDGKKAYKLSDQETPARFAARRVRVTGTLYEKTGIIKVERIEAIE